MDGDDEDDDDDDEEPVMVVEGLVFWVNDICQVCSGIFQPPEKYCYCIHLLFLYLPI